MRPYSETVSPRVATFGPAHHASVAFTTAGAPAPAAFSGQSMYSLFAGSAAGKTTAAFNPSRYCNVVVPVYEPVEFCPNTSNRALVTPAVLPSVAKRLPVTAITASGAPVRVHSARAGAPAGGAVPTAGGENGSLPDGRTGSGLGFGKFQYVVVCAHDVAIKIIRKTRASRNMR